MNIAIFGATGTSGRAILDEALARGHHVTALVRNRYKLGTDRENLKVIVGDVLDPAAVEATVAGQDAVISALGAGMKPTTLRTDGTRTIVEAMERTGVKRLVSQSVFGLGDTAKKLPLYWKVLVKPLMLRFAYRDHAGQEAVIAASDLNWTVTRPVSLRDWEPTGEYQHGSAGAMNGITLKIGLTDLARFTLDQIESDQYVREMPGISY